MNELRDFKEALLENLQDKSYAQTYLTVALEEYDKDNDAAAFLLALRDVAEAQGGLGVLAKKTKLNRQNLYKALTATGDPKLHTIETVLHALGYRFTIVPAN